jgi:Glycosyltransferases involved in cell wall biogenesis
MSDFLPLVSVVIPVYNGANYLAEAIDSALSQTYQNIEILVINDGSKDEGATRNIALSYGDKIRYFEKENGGVATALNLGIREMKGEYFSWLSHDDKYFPAKIQRQIEFLSQSSNKEVVLYSDIEHIDENSNHIFNHHFPHYAPHNFRPAFIKDELINGCTLLVPRICFKECGLFRLDLRTTQDYDLWFRFSEKYDFIHLQEILVYSRLHENQDTRKLQKIVVQERENLHLSFIKNLSISEISSFAKGDIAGYYIDFAFKMSKWRLPKSRNLAQQKALHNLFSPRITNTFKNLFKLSVLYFKSFILFILENAFIFKIKSCLALKQK